MKILNNKDDFTWYKDEIDVSAKYRHRHTGGEPARFPCRVISRFYDDPNGPYTWEHDFLYQQDVVCECCGKTSTIWPKQVQDD